MLNHAQPDWQDDFINELEIIVRRKATIKITVDEVWASEKEMRDDLHWSPYFDSKYCCVLLSSCDRTMHPQPSQAADCWG